MTSFMGSTTALSTSATGGGLVSGSTARYYPFGAWRTVPTQTLSARGYTGHLENMEIGAQAGIADEFLRGRKSGAVAGGAGTGHGGLASGRG